MIQFETLLAEIHNGKFKPIYFLHGLESYFIDQITDLIEKKALTDSEKAFNQSIFYGKEVDHLAVVDAARRYPMMASRQVVIIKEAQDMRSLKELQSYVQQPADTTVLVICHKHKKLNLNSSFGKALKSKAVVFEAKPLYDNQVPDWIAHHLKSRKLKIDPLAANLVAEYLGKDLSKVANEMEKLVINLQPGTTVDEKIIEEYIGISKDYNIFELQKAIGKREVLKANKIVHYFASNPRKNPVQVVIGSMATYFAKIYTLHFVGKKAEKDILEALKLRSAFFLREYRNAARNYSVEQTERALCLLKDYDLKSKGVDYNTVGKEDGALLRELVWKILH